MVCLLRWTLLFILNRFSAGVLIRKGEKNELFYENRPRALGQGLAHQIGFMQPLGRQVGC